MVRKQYLYILLTIFLVASSLVFTAPLYAISKMPSFSLPEITDGRPIDSKDLEGKVLLVIFFSTSCPPCMAEVPSLVELQQELSRDGFSVIAFSVDEQGAKSVAWKLEKLGVNYPVVMADSKIVFGFGGVRAIPASFLVNQRGDIVKSYVGYVPHSVLSKDIKDVIR